MKISINFAAPCIAVLHLLGAAALPARADDAFLVKDGQPQAEIIIAEQAPRTTRLAAQELQLYVEKIAGARLPIATEPSADAPVKVYVGQSPHTERLNVTAAGLKDGAYRIVSGDGWLALIGDDTDFTPVEPWPRNNGDWTSGRVHEQWDKLTGSTLGQPALATVQELHRTDGRRSASPSHESAAKDGTVHVWGFDERGSFNAVCGFLRQSRRPLVSAGRTRRGRAARRRRSRCLKIDETVQPDFPVRPFNIRFGVHGRETSRWAMRLGIRNPYGLQTAHGMHTMTHTTNILSTSHPDWFALYGGKRQNQPGQRLNQLCYSNEELLQRDRALRPGAVRSLQVRRRLGDAARRLHGHLPVPALRRQGLARARLPRACSRITCGTSSTAWRKEVRKTHPDKMISNCAYGTYTLPPENIDKLEPNVQVIIVGGRRPTSDRPEEQDEIRKLRADWIAKTDNPIMIFENYPFTDRGLYLPAYMPHVLGESINATKGVSRGEDIWLSVRQDFRRTGHRLQPFPGLLHRADVLGRQASRTSTAMFDEYCRLFYGPAGEEMQAFFALLRSQLARYGKGQATVDRALELFAAAASRGGRKLRLRPTVWRWLTTI